MVVVVVNLYDIDECCDLSSVDMLIFIECVKMIT